MYTWGPIQRTAATPGLTPWLLDTFTASNGTSPLSPHALDVYPTGMDNWKTQAAAPTEFGIISGNSFVVDTGGGDTRAIVQNYNAGETDIALALPIFLLLDLDLGTTGDYFRLRVNQGAGYNSDIDLLVYRNGDVYAQVIGEVSGYYETAFPYPNVGSGSHKVGLWISSTETEVIADGSAIDTAASVDHREFARYVVLDLFPDASPINGAVNLVAIYSGITLAQATALTT
jgi:hypothetical protein